MSSVQMPWQFHRPTYAEIDTRKLKANFVALKSLFPQGTFICPMVKANAYGHGDVEVARALRAAGAENLGVGLIEEGIGLRLSGDNSAILLFGLFEDRSAEAVIEFELTPVLSAWHQIDALERAAVKRKVSSYPVHLKFNTGMNRLGFDTGDAAKLRERLDASPTLSLKGLCTHLLRGDDAGEPGGESESQLTAFAEAVSHFDGMDLHVHALNSSGLSNLWSRVMRKKNLSPKVAWPLGARPGISTYGIQPSNDEEEQLELKPVLSFKSRIVKLHRLQSGERVSYNATWRAQRESLIGIVPAGYADGVFRLLSNKGRVLVRGEFVPMIGTVCMDYFMIDLTELEKQCLDRGQTASFESDEVVLIGEQGGASGTKSISAADVADLVGTISYEVLTHISERVPRVYIRDTSSGGNA